MSKTFRCIRFHRLAFLSLSFSLALFLFEPRMIHEHIPSRSRGFLLSLIPIPIFRFRCSCRRWTRSWTSWCTCRPRYPRVVSSKLRDMDFAVHSDVRSANRTGVDQYYQRLLYHNVPNNHFTLT